MFKKFITAAITTAVIATATIAAPTQAEAHNGIGLGIAAGILTGAVVGAAIVNSQDRYYDGYVYCHREHFVDRFGYVHVERVCHRG